MSLLEVLVALAIFLAALTVLGKLIIIGGERARDVQDLGRATQICQSKLAEVVSGVTPLSSQSDVALDEDPAWTWSLDCTQDSVPNLWDVTVRATRRYQDGNTIECEVHQRVLDPSIRGNAADGSIANANYRATQASSSSSSSSGTSSSGSGSTGSGSPMTSPSSGGKSTAPTTATKGS
jgi:type II secretory pathway pseudopilin PulG